MVKQITPEQALALSYTPFRFKTRKTDKRGNTVRDKDGEPVMEIAETPRFIKQGETQANALKRLRNHSLGRTKPSTSGRFIPSFTPGVTTAAHYVSWFESQNHLRLTGSARHLTHPSPVPEGPELTVEEDEFYADDLV